MRLLMSPDTLARIPFGVQILPTLMIEAVLFLSIYFDAANVLWALLTHLALCIVLALNLLTPGAPQDAGRWKALFLLSVATMGVLGVLGTLFAWSLKKCFSRFSTPFDEWYFALFPTGAALSGGRTLGEGKGVTIRNGTMTDLFKVATMTEKERLLAEIARDYRPAHARCLRLALNDEAASIRTLAASVVARIEKNCTDNWLRMKATAQRSDAEAWLELVRHLDSYSENGLLDKDRITDVLQAAREALTHVMANRQHEREASILLGKLLIKQGCHDEAIALFDGLLRQGETDAQLLRYRDEALFRAHRWSEMSEKWQSVLGFEHLLEEEPSSGQWCEYLSGHQNAPLLR